MQLGELQQLMEELGVQPRMSFGDALSVEEVYEDLRQKTIAVHDQRADLRENAERLARLQRISREGHHA